MRLFFVLVLLVHPAIAFADEPKKAEKPCVAHIGLGGEMDEGAPSEGMFGSSETLRQKIDRIKAASKDKTVTALYLRLDDMHVGFGKVNELRRAIAEFRASGKKVHAYTEEFDTKAYLVALACDSISVPESGGLNLVGLRAEVSYYKDALKLATLDVDVLKMGGYKSAVEPFLTSEMSPENREQITSMMNDNFEKEIIAALVAGRPNLKLTPAAAEALIDEGPFTARKALKLGLVDSLQYEDQFEAGLTKDEVKIVRNYGKPKKDSAGGFAALMEMTGPRRCN